MADARAIVITNKIPNLPLETFSGQPTDDIEAFLERFKLIKGIYGWKDLDARSYFIGLLAGPAKNFYFSNKEKLDVIEGFDAFLKEFEKHLPSTTSDPNNALFNRRKLDTETITGYFYDVTRLCQRADPAMSEATQIQHILKGLGFQML